MLQDSILIDYYLSSFEGHLEVVALLINHGAEVTCKDKKGYTPLHAAASNGQINIVKHLLNLGVEVCGNVLFVASTFLCFWRTLFFFLTGAVTAIGRALKENSSHFLDHEEHLVLHAVY